MNKSDLRIIERALSGQAITSEEAEQAMEAVEAMRRRDWAVRVLDAWAESNESNVPDVRRCEDGSWNCLAVNVIGAFLKDWDGPTPDAARHAAALAIWPTLSAEEQARIGECP